MPRPVGARDMSDILKWRERILPSGRDQESNWVMNMDETLSLGSGDASRGNQEAAGLRGSDWRRFTLECCNWGKWIEVVKWRMRAVCVVYFCK